MAVSISSLVGWRKSAAAIVGVLTLFGSLLGAKAQTNSQIDVLVVYTPEVEKKYTENGVRALALACVNATNKSFRDSRAPVLFRLVGVRKVTYKESGSLSVDLTRLTNKTDKSMDEVHEWRDRLGADLVHLIRRGSSGGIAGLAWLSIAGTESRPSGMESYGFAVTADDAALGNFTFAHEAGHNLGAYHNKTGPGSSNDKPVIPYSYGHRFIANGTEYRTIMAYAPGERLARWSNPDLTFIGQPTGVKDFVDNARAFIATGPIVAAYRESRSGGAGDLAISGVIDFRNAWPTFATRRTFNLVNRSRDSVAEVFAFKLPANMSIDWGGGVIPPGGRQRVTLTYRPSGFGRNDSGALQILAATGDVLAERTIRATSAQASAKAKRK